MCLARVWAFSVLWTWWSLEEPCSLIYISCDRGGSGMTSKPSLNVRCQLPPFFSPTSPQSAVMWLKKGRTWSHHDVGALFLEYWVRFLNTDLKCCLLWLTVQIETNPKRKDRFIIFWLPMVSSGQKPETNPSRYGDPLKGMTSPNKLSFVRSSHGSNTWLHA